MWARIVEIMLAFWLAISSFIFQSSCPDLWFRKNDLICSSLLLFFSLLSFANRFEKMHLCNGGVTLWMIFVAFHFPAAPILENELILGLLFLILALIPSHSELPPKGWRDFYTTLPKQ